MLHVLSRGRPGAVIRARNTAGVVLSTIQLLAAGPRRKTVAVSVVEQVACHGNSASAVTGWRADAILRNPPALFAPRSEAAAGLRFSPLFVSMRGHFCEESGEGAVGRLSETIRRCLVRSDSCSLLDAPKQTFATQPSGRNQRGKNTPQRTPRSQRKQRFAYVSRQNARHLRVAGTVSFETRHLSASAGSRSAFAAYAVFSQKREGMSPGAPGRRRASSRDRGAALPDGKPECLWKPDIPRSLPQADQRSRRMPCFFKRA